MYLELRPLKRKLKIFKQSHKGGLGPIRLTEGRDTRECSMHAERNT